MGFFDRFKPQHEQKREKKIRHAVDAKASERDAKEQAFANVPAGSKSDAPASTSAKESTKAKEKQKAPRGETRHAYRVLLRPLVTEKATSLKTQNRYTFAVNVNANKLSVKEAVLALYGVRPTDVTIQRFDGKVVRYGRSFGRTRSWKRAIVTLPAGKTIDVAEG